jgi:hypothetical protein
VVPVSGDAFLIRLFEVIIERIALAYELQRSSH